GLVWRRPRPVLRPKDPERDAKLAALRRLLRGLPAGGTGGFMGGGEVHTQPKGGGMWGGRGRAGGAGSPRDNTGRGGGGVGPPRAARGGGCWPGRSTGGPGG